MIRTCFLPDCENEFKPISGRKYCCDEHREKHKAMKRPTRAKHTRCLVCKEPLVTTSRKQGAKRYCPKPECQAEKLKRWGQSHKRGYDRRSDQYGVMMKCKCPMCEIIYKRKVFWTGHGMPRIFCHNCQFHRGISNIGDIHPVEVHARYF